MNFPADIWPKVLSLMEGDMTATTINTWFDDATPVALDANRLHFFDIETEKTILSRV